MRVTAVALGVGLIAYVVFAAIARLPWGPTIGSAAFGALFLWHGLRKRKSEQRD